MNHSRRSFAPLLLALAACAVLSAQNRQDLRDALAGAPRDLPWTDSTVRAKAAFNSGSEKIDPGLLAIAASVNSRGIDNLETAAKAFSVPTEGDLVEISLIAESEGDVAKLRRDVSQLGGRVKTTYKNYVYALVPPSAIPALARIDELYFAGRPAMYSASQDDLQNGSLDEGLLKIKADRLHKAGVRGQGVKVGILDFGFQRYQEMQAAGKVPAPVMAKAFNQSGRIENGVVHGTACAEIIHALAPDAQIYLAAMGEGDGHASIDEIIVGARWLKAQGVDIISYSGGSHYGPHNGTGLMDQLVEEITSDHRTLWVNAAGNEGAQHFRIDLAAGASGWIPVAPDMNAIALAPGGRAISLLVNWDDWGNDPLHPAATQDIDAVLFHYDKASGQVTRVGDSLTEQNGRVPPVESIATEATPGEIYLLALRATRVTRPLRIHVYLTSGGLLQPFDPTGSIGIPATSPAALAVGAVDVRNDKLEAYSSRGPTDDNRAKPDLSSYDKVSSLSYGQRFAGTSAACPHVSGLAALLKSQQQGSDTTALRNRLMSALRHPDSNDPGFGAGVTDVDRLAGPSGNRPPKTSSTSIELPEAFGGNVSTATLEEIRHSRSEPPFEVKVRLGRDGNPPEYAIGDDLRLGYRTAEDSYCTLINRDADGQYTVLPLDGDRLEAGRKYVYPDKIRVSAPTGSEEFLFICAKDRVDLNRWQQSSGEGRIAVDIAPYEVKQ